MYYTSIIGTKTKPYKVLLLLITGGCQKSRCVLSEGREVSVDTWGEAMERDRGETLETGSKKGGEKWCVHLDCEL